MLVCAPFRCKNKRMDKDMCKIHLSCLQNKSRSSLDKRRKCAVGTQIAS